MENYMGLEMEVIVFENVDVITNSPDPARNTENETPWS